MMAITIKRWHREGGQSSRSWIIITMLDHAVCVTGMLKQGFLHETLSFVLSFHVFSVFAINKYNIPDKYEPVY